MENVDITTLHTGSKVERDGKTLEVESVIEDKDKTYIELKKAVVAPADDFDKPLSEV